MVKAMVNASEGMMRGVKGAAKKVGKGAAFLIPKFGSSKDEPEDAQP